MDLLLYDPENDTRYEVELQLGATDESHIIRRIEYWDIEKARYPNYDHVAVIVAEDVMSRFLNVISLLNKSIPIIAIQLNAWSIGDVTTLTATKVLDLALAAPDDEDDAHEQQVDRSFWQNKAGSTSLAVVDGLSDLIREATGNDTLQLKLNRHYIGLARDGTPDNFFTMRPRKSDYVWTEVKIPRSDEITTRMDDAGLDVDPYSTRYSLYTVRFRPDDLTERRELLTELIQRASGLKPPATPATIDASESPH